MAQKLLELSYQSKRFDTLFGQLESRVKELVVDVNGNHVVQKIGELTKGAKCLWLIEGILGQVGKLVQDSHGCRLIQQTLEQADVGQLADIYGELLKLQKNLCLS